VSVAPLNSIESDDQEHTEVGSEVRLCQSDFHIGLPGDAIETATNTRGSVPTEVAISDGPVGQGPTQPCAVENVIGAEINMGERPVAQTGGKDGAAVFATAMTDVAANEEVSDEPIAPGLISTPASSSIKRKGFSERAQERTRSPEAQDCRLTLRKKQFRGNKKLTTSSA